MVFQNTFQMSGFSGKRLMKGRALASSTALPRISAATAIDVDVEMSMPEPRVISTLMNATM